MANKQEGMNFNTLLLGIALAVMGWVGYETSQAGKAIAILQTQNSSVQASMARLEDRMNVTISRPEYESAILEIKTRLRAIDIELQKLHKTP